MSGCHSTICAPFRRGMKLTCRDREGHDGEHWSAGDLGRVTWTTGYEHPLLTAGAVALAAKFAGTAATG